MTSPRFRREDLVVDETFIDEDGTETPIRLVEPDDMRFDDATVTCIFADGHTVVINRADVREIGLNPTTKMPTFVSRDGYSIAVPEHMDTQTATRWFKRGRGR